MNAGRKPDLTGRIFALNDYVSTYRNYETARRDFSSIERYPRLPRSIISSQPLFVHGDNKNRHRRRRTYGAGISPITVDPPAVYRPESSRAGTREELLIVLSLLLLAHRPNDRPDRTGASPLRAARITATPERMCARARAVDCFFGSIFCEIYLAPRSSSSASNVRFIDAR